QGLQVGRVFRVVAEYDRAVQGAALAGDHVIDRWVWVALHAVPADVEERVVDERQVARVDVRAVDRVGAGRPARVVADDLVGRRAGAAGRAVHRRALRRDGERRCGVVLRIDG